MESSLDQLLRAIAAIEQTERDRQPLELSAQYLTDIAAVDALPQNRDGADKSWVWPTYVSCRRHFVNVRPR